MIALWRATLSAVFLAAMVLTVAAPVQARDKISINLVNQGEFPLSIELRDKMCGGNIIFHERLKGGEVRVIEICANADGIGGLRAAAGSGCSQVKRFEFVDIKAGDAITF